jgi:hypothetical protein
MLLSPKNPFMHTSISVGWVFDLIDVTKPCSPKNPFMAYKYIPVE